MRDTHYIVEANNGNIEVQVSLDDCAYVEVDDTDTCYWVGVVYAYKMTDDTTRNVYDCQDYRIMGAACQMVKQIPEFEELEYIVGYGQGVGCSEYADWSVRAKQWLERERRIGLRASHNPLAEGAD
jgi:hypothetical protein